MDRSDLRELVPHYVVMLILIFAVLAIIEAVASDLSFWVEVALIFVLVFAYRAVVQRLGYGPSAWEIER